MWGLSYVNLHVKLCGFFAILRESDVVKYFYMADNVKYKTYKTRNGAQRHNGADVHGNLPKTTENSVIITI